MFSTTHKASLRSWTVSSPAQTRLVLRLVGAELAMSVETAKSGTLGVVSDPSHRERTFKGGSDEM